jgi:hypothetical protein
MLGAFISIALTFFSFLIQVLKPSWIKATNIANFENEANHPLIAHQ